MYLGIRAVIAKSFARIHLANLINFGIVPMVFKSPADYDAIEQGDVLEIKGIRAALKKGEEDIAVQDTTKKKTIELIIAASPRQREMLIAGGLLNLTRARAQTEAN